MEIVNSWKKRTYLMRYQKYNQGYKKFLMKYADAIPGSDRYEEFQRRKDNKNKTRKRLYDETASLLAQVTDPLARFIGELTFLEGFSLDEVANLVSLSENRCTRIFGKIYIDVQINL